MQIGLLCGTDLTGLMPPAHRSTSKWHIIAWQSCARNAAEVKLLGNAALCIVCCFAVPQPFKSSTETRRANAAPRVALVLPFLVPTSNAWHAEMRGHLKGQWVRRALRTVRQAPALVLHSINRLVGLIQIGLLCGTDLTGLSSFSVMLLSALLAALRKPAEADPKQGAAPSGKPAPETTLQLAVSVAAKTWPAAPCKERQAWPKSGAMSVNLGKDTVYLATMVLPAGFRDMHTLNPALPETIGGWARKVIAFQDNMFNIARLWASPGNLNPELRMGTLLSKRGLRPGPTKQDQRLPPRRQCQVLLLTCLAVAGLKRQIPIITACL
ncbi:hypothetical protein AK812_SmicGene30209 [Symbiodinium microadriaticum]|uniref:Uncharacterized protein n=1 Tax=Symbiodinium microadriaticum TaxID=2951 RepID=A0A1Q9CZW3_SYMMI|nr:hypothetical protein AK812_SmicGene30209 [Symbiodinium microadriaticum]